MNVSYSRKRSFILLLLALSLSFLLASLPGNWVQADPATPEAPLTPLHDSLPLYATKNVTPPLLPTDVQGSLKTFDAVADAEVRQSAPNTNFGIAPTFDVGYDNDADFHQVQRGLLHFDVTTYLVPGTVIHQAILNLYYSGLCDYLPPQSILYQAHGVAAPWAEMSVTWNNQPGTTQSYGAASIPADTNWGYRQFDITDLVQDWINGTQPEYGIMVTGPESPPYPCAYRTFLSKGGGGFDSGPLLQVDYTAPPAALSVSQNQVTFFHRCGAGEPAPAPVTVPLTSNKADLSNWTASVTGGGSWLNVDKSSGSLSRLLPDEIELSVTEAGACPSTKTAEIQISAAGLTNSPQTISVTFLQSTEEVNQIYLPAIQKSGPSNLSAMQAVADDVPHRMALVISTADYEYLNDPSSFSVLRSAVWGTNLLAVRGDGMSVRSILQASGYDQVIVLSEELATYANVLAAVQHLIDKANADSAATPPGSTPRAEILIYFSGHGGPITDMAPLDEADGLDELLGLYDTNDTPQFADHLLDDQLRSMLDTLAAEINLAVIIDACNSGGMEVTHPNRAIVTASQEAQNSWESSELEHGVFTYYILKALQNPASDTNNDGWLSVEEIYHYAKDPVAQYVADNTPEEQDLHLDAPQDLNVISFDASP